MCVAFSKHLQDSNSGKPIKAAQCTAHALARKTIHIIHIYTYTYMCIYIHIHIYIHIYGTYICHIHTTNSGSTCGCQHPCVYPASAMRVGALNQRHAFAQSNHAHASPSVQGMQGATFSPATHTQGMCCCSDACRICMLASPTTAIRIHYLHQHVALQARCICPRTLATTVQMK